MQEGLIYGIYVVAALGAIAVYAALPKDGRISAKALIWMSAGLAGGGLMLVLSKIAGPSSKPIYFFALTLLAIGGSLRVVTHPRPVYSALFFMIVVLSTAGLMVLSGAEFLAAALVIVYAGAILVTYVFVIMLAQQSSPTHGGQFGDAMNYDKSAREPIWAVVAGFVLIGAIAGVLVGHKWETVPAIVGADRSNIEDIGKLLMTDFAVSVELAGVLLMVAMVGAIALARKQLPQAEDFSDSMPVGEIGKHVKPF